MDRASVLHRTGSYLLMFLGAMNLVNHLAGKATPPASPAAGDLRTLMREVEVTAFGVVRSMEDVADGFVLAFTVFAFLVGVLALLVDKHGSRGLITATRVICAGLLGVITSVGLRAWLPAPVMLSGLAAGSFLAAIVVARLEPAPGTREPPQDDAEPPPAEP